MRLDLLNAHSLCHAFNLVEFSKPAGEIEEIGDPVAVAFEMRDIDGVKPHQAKGPTGVAIRTLLKLVEKSQ